MIEGTFVGLQTGLIQVFHTPDGRITPEEPLTLAEVTSDDRTDPARLYCSQSKLN